MRGFVLFVNLTALSFFCDITLADDYQTELDADVTNTQHPSSANTDAWSLSGIYYFNKVDVKDHPLAEAAFLEQRGNLKLMYARQKTDMEFWRGYYDPFPDSNGFYSPFVTKSDGSIINSIANAAIEVYVPDTILYIGGSYDQTRQKIHIPSDGRSPTFDEKIIDNSWSARLGITPVTGLRVWSEFYEDQDVKDDWNVKAKYVRDWNGNAINIEGGYQHEKEFSDTYNLGSDFYFNRSFSVGATYDYNENYTSRGIRARKFFNDNVSLQASYTRSMQTDAYNLGVSWRI